MEQEKKLEKVMDVTPLDEETLCPSCGGFVGTYEVCPRCGASVKKRMSIQFFKYLSLALAILGLLFLYLWAINREVPCIQIAQITPTMNFAYVRVRGEVVRDTYIAPPDPRYGLSRGLSFTITDKTGTLQVRAFEHVARELIKQGQIPRQGDRVEVGGQLNVQKERVRLTIKVPRHLKIERRTIAQMRIKDLTVKHALQQVSLQGRITRCRPGRGGRGPQMKWLLNDGSGSLWVTLWQRVYQGLPKQKLGVGACVKVRGVLKEYAGQLELHPALPQDITIEQPAGVAASELKPTAIKNILQQPPGTHVKLQGRITLVLPNKRDTGPRVKWLVTDDTGSLMVTLWARAYDQLRQREQYKAGAQVTVAGELRQYRGKAELHPQTAADIHLDKPATTTAVTSSQTKGVTMIASLTMKMVNKVITVQGILLTQRRFKNGMRLLLKDKSGKALTVILWKRAFPAGIPRFIRGAHLQVHGKLAKFKDKLELWVEQARDLLVIKKKGG